jgi:hypothetical protein
MIRQSALASLLLLAMAGGCMAADWPPLPGSGFVSGRAANFADVKSGDAAFVLADNRKNIIGKPLPVQIPQYAIVKETNERAIVIQAEESNGMKIIGVRTIDGEFWTVLHDDLQWLGTELPQK